MALGTPTHTARMSIIIKLLTKNVNDIDIACIMLECTRTSRRAIVLCLPSAGFFLTPRINNTLFMLYAFHREGELLLE